MCRTFTARTVPLTSAANYSCFLAVVHITSVDNSQAPGFVLLSHVIGVKYTLDLDEVQMQQFDQFNFETILK